MSPQQIAHYRIAAKIGEGGVGAVYRAGATKLNRDVAIKVLPETPRRRNPAGRTLSALQAGASGPHRYQSRSRLA